MSDPFDIFLDKRAGTPASKEEMDASLDRIMRILKEPFPEPPENPIECDFCDDTGRREQGSSSWPCPHCKKGTAMNPTTEIQKVLCAVCGTTIESAMVDGDARKIPGGVLFEGGRNFGSTLYDAGVDGMEVHMVICDPCVKSLIEDGAAWEHDARAERRAQEDRYQAMFGPKKRLCPHCGFQFTLQPDECFVPSHPWPPPHECGHLASCPGSGGIPRLPDSQEPLGKDAEKK